MRFTFVYSGHFPIFLGEALLQLTKTAGSLKSRLLQLLDKKAKLPHSDNNDDDNDDGDANTSSARDLEVSISLCLRRLVELARSCDIVSLFGKSSSGDAIDSDNEYEDGSGDQETNTLCSAITVHIARELKSREVAFPDIADDGEGESKGAPHIPAIWTNGDLDLHKCVAETVKDGLDLLLTITAWRFNKESDRIDSKENQDEEGANDIEDGDPSNHVVIKVRDRVLKILHYCFAQHLDTPEHDDDEPIYSPEHLAFSRALGEHGCKVAGDLRSLFPKSLADADSPFLRACALLDNDDSLLGGLQCILASNYSKVRT